ncbi:MAG TPA: chorismate mutase [Cryptosporangiaceae bacterium]|nr:chorismate mutase [Cryptosporangiaceae bacterium]
MTAPATAPLGSTATDTPNAPSGESEPDDTDPIAPLRGRIDAIDTELIQLWQERARLSRQVGTTRIAAGGTRLVLAREQQIVDTFRAALGAEGAQLAMLLLRAGRGPL